MRKLVVVIIVMGALCGPGCLSLPEASEAPREVVIESPEGFTGVDAADFAYDVTAEMLRRSLFEIDRVDRAYGRIITQPLVGQGFGEFWRRDSVGLANWLESSLHRTRRTVIAELEDLDETRTRVRFRTVVERFAFPQRRNTTPGEQIFAGVLVQQNPLEDRAGVGSLTNVNEPAGGFWADLGADSELERKLVARLTRLAQRRRAQEEAGLATPVAPQ